MHVSIAKLLAGEHLSKMEAESLLREIAQGDAGSISQDEIREFLTLHKNRLPTPEEFAGYRSAMISVAVPLQIDAELLDLCGTGGDCKNTFNISTATAFVVAACGISVAKHGNYGSSSSCGSSNVLEALGVPFPKDRDQVLKQLDAAKLSFLHAPLWHPAMHVVAPIRKELGFKTIFNLLGPVVNPANPKFQMVGVYSSELQTLYRETLALERYNFAVVHATDGYDEISLTDEAKVCYADATVTISAEHFGAETISPLQITGGQWVAQSALIVEHILKGSGTPEQTSVVAANAAIALSLVRGRADLKALYQEALDLIRSGCAIEPLQILRSFV